LSKKAIEKTSLQENKINKSEKNKKVKPPFVKKKGMVEKQVHLVSLLW